MEGVVLQLGAGALAALFLSGVAYVTVKLEQRKLRLVRQILENGDRESFTELLWKCGDTKS
jgi:hypothetical protein